MEETKIHLVKATFHTQFKIGMESCGISADYYFDRVGLPTQVSDPDSLLPLIPFFQLANMVATSEKIPDFGSRVAQLTPWHKIPSLEPLIRKCAGLKNLLETFCQVASSQSSPVLFKLKDEGSHFSFYYTNTLFFKGDIQLEMYRITSMIQLVQLATGSQWRPEAIRLIMPRSRVVKKCPLLSKSRIAFSQPISAIAIEANLLQLPVHMDIPASVKITNNKQADIYNNFDDAIRQIIITYSLTKNISIEDISRATDISVRSLQRRLKDEGLKFNDLLNQAKFFHAKNELRDPQMTIKEVSESLGYSDPANFTRAFRRWSGLSPSSFRKREIDRISLE